MDSFVGEAISYYTPRGIKCPLIALSYDSYTTPTHPFTYSPVHILTSSHTHQFTHPPNHPPLIRPAHSYDVYYIHRSGNPRSHNDTLRCDHYFLRTGGPVVGITDRASSDVPLAVGAGKYTGVPVARYPHDGASDIRCVQEMNI